MFLRRVLTVYQSSYQPLPTPLAVRSFRPITGLDPRYSSRLGEKEGHQELRPPAFRLRRGRGGTLRLDRRCPVYSQKLGNTPKSDEELSDWLFPDLFRSKPASLRPKSIDDVEKGADEEEDENEDRRRRRRLNEVWRYDVDHGGSTGVGMSVADDEDRILIDDLETK